MRQKERFDDANHTKVETKEKKEEAAVVANLKGIDQPVEGSRQGGILSGILASRMTQNPQISGELSV